MNSSPCGTPRKTAAPREHAHPMHAANACLAFAYRTAQNCDSALYIVQQRAAARDIRLIASPPPSDRRLDWRLLLPTPVTPNDAHRTSSPGGRCSFHCFPKICCYEPRRSCGPSVLAHICATTVNAFRRAMHIPHRWHTRCALFLFAPQHILQPINRDAHMKRLKETKDQDNEHRTLAQ